MFNNTATTAANGRVIRHPSGGTFNAASNWWGVNTGAGTNDVSGTATVTPFLQLKVTPASNSISVAGSTQITASFLTDSANNSVSLANLAMLIGLPISFSGTLGTISNAQAIIQANGTATATFTAGCTSGAGAASATVDNGTASGAITINKFNSTTAASTNINPSVFGQSVTFTANVTPNSAGCGTPSGSVQFKDGATNLGSSVSLSSGSAQLMVSNLSVGSHTITADYLGDAAYNMSSGSLPNNPQVITRFRFPACRVFPIGQSVRSLRQRHP